MTDRTRSTGAGVDLAMSLRRAQLRKQAACETALSALDVTLPQWGMLHAVAARTGSSTHGLALYTGQSDQSAGALVSRLQRRGLIERRGGKGKALRHYLSASGTEVLQNCESIVEKVMHALTTSIPTADLRVLERCLDTISAVGLAESGAYKDVFVTEDSETVE